MTFNHEHKILQGGKAIGYIMWCVYQHLHQQQADKLVIRYQLRYSFNLKRRHCNDNRFIKG